MQFDDQQSVDDDQSAVDALLMFAVFSENVPR
jgi:hypothetical protein